MAIDEKSIQTLRQLDKALPTNPSGLSKEELCKIYSQIRPLIDVLIKLIERVPVYGVTLAKLILLAEALADSACGITPRTAGKTDDVKMDRGEGLHPLAAAPQPYVYWTFPGDIRRGDCTIRGGATFYLYQDGSTRWTCDISSSDSGDEWDGDFLCNNAGGVRLWADHYHFDISDDNVWKRWDESRGPNGSRAASFNEAQGLTFSCSC